MQNAAGGGTSAQFDVRNDSYRSIVSDLVSLVERVRESMKLIELAVAEETPPGNQELAANVIVLDDVTPRYAKAYAELAASNAGLGMAVHLMLDTRTSRHGRDGRDGNARRPFRAIGGA
jgi:hypothetical protein